MVTKFTGSPYPYGPYVYIENSTFLGSFGGNLEQYPNSTYVKKCIEILYCTILVSFSLRRIIEFDFYPTKFTSESLFPLTFVMENLINYANFRDTHLDDNLMQ